MLSAVVVAQPDGQGLVMVADAVTEADPDQVGSDMMAKIEKIIEKLKGENLSLHAELGAEKTAHAPV